MLNDFLNHIKTSINSNIIEVSDTMRSEWERATFAYPSSIDAILSPSSSAQLVTIVELANQYSISLHPISGGKNWGYGSRLPAQSRAVVVNLQHLNRISFFDEHAGVVTLEAGVTYQQLQQFLVDSGCQWRLNGPGSSPLASVVGNTLERGLNQGAQMEHWHSVISAEAVLPEGKLIQTNSDSYGKFAGADVLGLFFQSSLGVVTSLTLSLDHLPNHWQHLHFTWQEHSQPYTQISDALHTLRRKQLITNSISIHNAEKILSLIGRYPYIDTQGKTPLPTDNKQAAIDAIAGGDWFCETAISAPTQTSLDSIRNEISILLNTLDITLHWDAPNQSGPLFHDFTQTACEQTYWRKTDDLPPTLDPDRDNCGVIWLSPIVPWQSDSLSSLYNTTYEYCYQYGFEPLVSFQFPNHRYAYMIIAIVYDRLTPGDDEKAKQLYEKLKHSITKLGYPLYRQGLLGKDHIHTNATVLEKIQTLLDPNAIFQQHSSKK